jgi:DNA-binding XRE family transcriptional regulator
MSDRRAGKNVVANTRLRVIPERRGLKASEIARQAGVCRQMIYAIEKGEYIPNTVVAIRLARILQVSVEDLFAPAKQRLKQRSSVKSASLRRPSIMVERGGLEP